MSVLLIPANHPKNLKSLLGAGLSYLSIPQIPCKYPVQKTNLKMEPYKEKPGGRAEGSIDAEEVLKRDRSIQQSALDVEHDLFVGSNKVGADDISTFFLERLIHMTSKAQSWHASDDEAVDVTEPRLESFCMVNVKSP